MRRDDEGKKGRLLVVDDDLASRKILGGILLNAGYDVTLAADGPEALRAARADAPDVVLLDVMMPGMTGYEVCEALKRAPETRLVQVMLVTALDGTPDKVEGLDGGADDYVTKPVRRDEFLAKVRALLRAGRLLHDLEKARCELARRNEELELKRMLAQTLVHDLKNPLAGVLGNLDLMQMRPGEDVSELVERCRRAAQRMMQMVSNLVDVEALEQGDLRPASERVDLAELTLVAVEDVEALAEARGITLRREHVTTCRLEGDGAMLRRMIDNLVGNAVTRSPDGGLVSIGARPVSGGVEWTITDQGPEIPRSERERLFDKYAQGELQFNGVTASHGLGLTLCRMVIEAHRGEVRIESAPGGGTRLRVRMKGVAPDPPRAGKPLAVSV